MKKNKKISRDWLFLFLGIGFLVLGFWVHKNSGGRDQMTMVVPYLFIALGCGVFGHFTGNIMKYYSIKNHEDLMRQLEIEKKDERNILITEKSKAKAYDLMIYLFAALILIFSLMGVDKLQIVIIVATYLSIQVYALYWSSKLESKM